MFLKWTMNDGKDCEMHGHRYAMISKNDIVIPPPPDDANDYL